MTVRVRYADRFVRSNKELDSRVRRLAARRLAGDELESRVGIRTMNAANLSEESRIRYGFGEHWQPGRRRKATGKRRTTYYR
jgi:hypothetical protein